MIDGIYDPRGGQPPGTYLRLTASEEDGAGYYDEPCFLLEAVDEWGDRVHCGFILAIDQRSGKLRLCTMCKAEGLSLDKKGLIQMGTPL